MIFLALLLIKRYVKKIFQKFQQVYLVLSYKSYENWEIPKAIGSDDGDEVTVDKISKAKDYHEVTQTILELGTQIWHS